MASTFNIGDTTLTRYIKRTGITDRGVKRDIHRLIQHLKNLNVYNDVLEIYMCSSDYNDQTKSKVMAFKNPANDGTITGTLLNWNLEGIETGVSCGFEIPFNRYIDPSIFCLTKLTGTTLATTGDNGITIQARSFSGLGGINYTSFGSTGTGGTASVMWNFYDYQNTTSNSNVVRKYGIATRSYTSVKNRFFFTGMSMPIANSSETIYTYPYVYQYDDSINSSARSSSLDGTASAIQSGGKNNMSYLYFTSVNGNASGYHNFYIFFKQTSTNLSATVFPSIAAKVKETIGRNLTLPA